MIKILFILFFTHLSLPTFANVVSFENWVKNFKIYALEIGISEKTLNLTMSNVRFLPNVIKYDRFQPEFYEDTRTYISKRSSQQKVVKGIKVYKKNKNLLI